MRNITETVRALCDAEVIINSRLLEDSEKGALLDEVLVAILPDGLSSPKEKVIRIAIERIRAGYPAAAKKENGKTTGTEEPTEVVSERDEEAPEEGQGPTEGVEEQAQDTRSNPSSGNNKGPQGRTNRHKGRRA
ncbi:hypothetical protein UFOVP344_31 [uncultured Caudovirales phage]|uniref:Uncharacterized protein n=1 Tax=uncultured Caudovirales phage TaxID=2100421 RepID=A0A6J5M4F8_9CAUD|nr:hypothetical protein UFOVP344_31 [uncultured Caudovirales phage]